MTTHVDKANPSPGDDCEYDLDFIINNPIQTTCIKCARKEPINAPELGNVRCFWCGGKLAPIDAKAYRDRVTNLWRYVSGGPALQMGLI